MQWFRRGGEKKSTKPPLVSQDEVDAIVSGQFQLDQDEEMAAEEVANYWRGLMKDDKGNESVFRRREDEDAFRILILNPRISENLVRLGYDRLAQGELKLAALTCFKAIAFGPGDMLSPLGGPNAAWLLMTQIQAEYGDIQRAKAALGEARKGVDPRVVKFHESLIRDKEKKERA